MADEECTTFPICSPDSIFPIAGLEELRMTSLAHSFHGCSVNLDSTGPRQHVVTDIIRAVEEILKLVQGRDSVKGFFFRRHIICVFPRQLMQFL